MGVIGVLLILTAIVLFVIVANHAIKLVKAKEKKLDDKTIKILAAAIGFFIVGAAIMPVDEKSDAVEKEEPAEEVTEEVDAIEEEGVEEAEDANVNVEKEVVVTKEPALDFSVDEFRKRFDTAADEFSLPFRSNKDAAVEAGEVYDTQKIVTASDYVSVFATLTKGEEIVALNLVGSGNGTTDSGAQIIGTIGATIAGTQPELTPDERGEILKELGVMGDEGLPKDMTTVTRGDYQYSFQYSDITGAMFFVEPAE